MNPTALPRSAPEAQGVRSSALNAFVDALDRTIDEVHSLMVVRRGHVVAEGWWNPYAADRPHLLFSLTKSFTSTAVGLATAEGRLSLDDPVVKFFPGVAPAKPSRHLSALTVRHLLTMSTGRLTDSMNECGRDPQGDWVRGFFRRPWLQAPGSPFVYDTGASHVLGAIVAAVTGEDLLEYLMPRLFSPLGIEAPVWETDPKGRRIGGFGLSLKTEDIAKFGQLLLQKGQWAGKTVIPAEWVALATSKQVDNDRFAPNPKPDWRQGYGFQFWQCRDGGFRGDGAFGQYCIVLPDRETVVAITAAVSDMQPLLELVWSRLVPALTPGSLDPDPEAARSLGRRLANLGFAPPAGEPGSDREPWIGGRRFVLENNGLKIRELRFAFEGQGLTLTTVDQTGVHTLRAGRGHWLEGPSSVFSAHARLIPGTQPRAEALASSFAWTGPRSLTLVCRAVEAPFVSTLNVFFEERCLRVEGRPNVGFGGSAWPRLVGVARKAP